MADINSPKAIKFCNEMVRPLADELIRFAYNARRVKDRYTAIGGQVLIPNDASPLMDGATTSGIPEVTGADVNVALGILDGVLTALEANNKLQLIQLLKVGPGRNDPVV